MTNCCAVSLQRLVDSRLSLPSELHLTAGSHGVSLVDMEDMQFISCNGSGGRQYRLSVALRGMGR